MSITKHEQGRELMRHGVEMALYIALSLLAVMVALPSAMERTETVEVAVALAVTTVGLLAAHWLAFRVSAQWEPSTGVAPRPRYSKKVLSVEPVRVFMASS